MVKHEYKCLDVWIIRLLMEERLRLYLKFKDYALRLINGDC